MTQIWRQVKYITIYPYLNYTAQPEGVTPQLNMFPTTISTSASIVQNVAEPGVYTIPFHQGAPLGLATSSTSTTVRTSIARRGDLAPGSNGLLFNIPTAGECNIGSDSYILFDVAF